MVHKYLILLILACLPLTPALSVPLPYGVKDQPDLDFSPTKPQTRRLVDYVRENPKKNEADILFLLKETRELDKLDDRIVRALVKAELEKVTFQKVGQKAGEIGAAHLPHLAITWYPQWVVEKDGARGILDQVMDVLKEMQVGTFNWQTGGKQDELPYDQRVVAVKWALFLLLPTEKDSRALEEKFNRLNVAKRIPVPAEFFEIPELLESPFFSKEGRCFYALHAGFLWGGPNRNWNDSRENDLYRDFFSRWLSDGDLSRDISTLNRYGLHSYGFREEALLHEFNPQTFLFRGGLDASGLVSLYTDMPGRGTITSFMSEAQDSSIVYPTLQKGDGFCFPLTERAHAVGIFLRYVDVSDVSQGFYAVSAGRRSSPPAAPNPDLIVHEGVRIAKYRAPGSSVKMALIRPAA